jgi:hypothetical protein
LPRHPDLAHQHNVERRAEHLRASAPRAVAKLGDLSRRMKPTAIGFLIELTTEEWAAIAIEHQLRFAGRRG